MNEIEKMSTFDLKEYIIKFGIELLNRLEEDDILFDKVGEFLHEIDLSDDVDISTYGC